MSDSNICYYHTRANAYRLEIAERRFPCGLLHLTVQGLDALHALPLEEVLDELERLDLVAEDEHGASLAQLLLTLLRPALRDVLDQQPRLLVGCAHVDQLLHRAGERQRSRADEALPCFTWRRSWPLRSVFFNRLVIHVSGRVGAQTAPILQSPLYLLALCCRHTHYFLSPSLLSPLLPPQQLSSLHD